MKRARSSFSRIATSTLPTGERWNRQSRMHTAIASASDDPIEVPVALQVEPELRAAYAAEAALAAGKLGPAVTDCESSAVSAKREQGEVDAAPPQDQRAGKKRRHRNEQQRERCAGKMTPPANQCR